MEYFGKISKLNATYGDPVQYHLPLNDEQVPLNPFLGQSLRLTYEKIICMGCGQGIKKSYQDGYCYPCTQRLARCDFCILKPERCHYHLGTCREPKWGEDHCMKKHIVYLANASHPKVGITRHTNVPNRWIDQGAVMALPLFETNTRRVAGYLEVAIAKEFSDKTNWRRMLNNQVEVCDLLELRNTALTHLNGHLDEINQIFGQDAYQLIQEPQLYEIKYPVMTYPTKIQSLSFDKTRIIEGQLLGIKGQYLIFDKGVLNIRKHSGYVIALEPLP